METWKSIPGFCHYEASDMGNIRSTCFEIIRSNGRHYTNKGTVITQRIDRYGYKIVQLYIGKKRYARKWFGLWC